MGVVSKFSPFFRWKSSENYDYFFPINAESVHLVHRQGLALATQTNHKFMSLFSGSKITRCQGPFEELE